MATSSIFDTVKIKDAKGVEDFIDAVEESERLSPMIPANGVPFRMATREDTRRLHEMRKKNREQKKAVAG